MGKISAWKSELSTDPPEQKALLLPWGPSLPPVGLGEIHPSNYMPFCSITRTWSCIGNGFRDADWFSHQAAVKPCFSSASCNCNKLQLPRTQPLLQVAWTISHSSEAGLPYANRHSRPRQGFLMYKTTLDPNTHI